MSGFGSHFATEAVPGALPQGRNSPQKPPFGLYAEQLSGTAFTAPRHENRRTWLYRTRPSAEHPPYRPYGGARLFAPGASAAALAPNRLRWDPLAMPSEPTDLIDGLVTMVANRDPADLEGVAVHVYRANKDMETRAFVDADGEMLFIPQLGGLTLLTLSLEEPHPWSPEDPFLYDLQLNLREGDRVVALARRQRARARRPRGSCRRSRLVDGFPRGAARRLGHRPRHRQADRRSGAEGPSPRPRRDA
jgi:hypothetical protein